MQPAVELPEFASQLVERLSDERRATVRSRSVRSHDWSATLALHTSAVKVALVDLDTRGRLGRGIADRSVLHDAPDALRRSSV